MIEECKLELYNDSISRRALADPQFPCYRSHILPIPIPFESSGYHFTLRE